MRWHFRRQSRPCIECVGLEMVAFVSEADRLTFAAKYLTADMASALAHGTSLPGAAFGSTRCAELAALVCKEDETEARRHFVPMLRSTESIARAVALAGLAHAKSFDTRKQIEHVARVDDCEAVRLYATNLLEDPDYPVGGTLEVIKDAENKAA